MLNNKGYSTGFGWVYALVSLAGLGILYITFDQVFVAHLVPVIKNQVSSPVAGIDNATQTQIFGEIDKYMSFFHTLPYIIFFVVVIFMIVIAIRKEREEM